MQTLTLKSGDTYKGYWNGKQYGSTIYFNISTDGTKAGINWKKSIKIERNEIKSLLNISDEFKNNHDVNAICPHCHTRCYGDCQA